ncbi:hypothetical protein BX600DRAFT_177444 [Xylariales sp. PMI_506]|nr:hypothetical protein BX600DRAFT_177444 [Xylariales sp. PMI_506]
MGSLPPYSLSFPSPSAVVHIVRAKQNLVSIHGFFFPYTTFEMRLFSMIATLLLALLPVVAATSLADLPTCGLECITGATFRSSCALGNLTCICNNTPLNDEVQDCVVANCTIKEQLASLKFSYDVCGHEAQDRTELVMVIGVTFGALGVLAFVLRCTARFLPGGRGWMLDDWLMALTMCFMVPLCAFSIPLAKHGLGLDLWNVSPDNITQILYLYFWDELFYVTSLALTKISMLIFYLQVFPKRGFRICCYVLIGLNIIYALGFDMVCIFQCSPIEGVWLSWDGEYKAKCLSINIMGWVAAAVNIALDLVTIILPLPELFQLSLSLKKKSQILTMFMLGFFVTIVSGVRLKSLIDLGRTRNVTQEYVEVGYWSTIEVPVGIICACLPAIRSLLAQLFPSMFAPSSPIHSAYAFSSRGFPSRRSNIPKLTSTTGSTQIRVKQEWTVMSDPVDLDDVELRRFQQNAGLSRAVRIGLSKPHEEWSRHSIPFQGGTSGSSHVISQGRDSWSGGTPHTGSRDRDSDET